VEKGVNVVLQGHYAVCQYEGGSTFLTTSSHREKNLDIDHVNQRVRLEVEFPLKSGRMVTVGVQYQMIESEGSITATDQTAEEILANRARFNKYATFTLESIVAMLGLTF